VGHGASPGPHSAPVHLAQILLLTLQLSLPETPLVLFIVSTTGAGDFPSAALPFWHFLLRATLPPDVLEDVTFATFGLGDSSYAKYCWPTRKINKRLKALGAHEVCEAGEGDDQHYLG
jgi:sulfite reductase alpha subunit-like flavoprotein